MTASLAYYVICKYISPPTSAQVEAAVYYQPAVDEAVSEDVSEKEAKGVMTADDKEVV